MERAKTSIHLTVHCSSLCLSGWDFRFQWVILTSSNSTLNRMNWKGNHSAYKILDFNVILIFLFSFHFWSYWTRLVGLVSALKNTIYLSKQSNWSLLMCCNSVTVTTELFMYHQSNTNWVRSRDIWFILTILWCFRLYKSCFMVNYCSE